MTIKFDSRFPNRLDDVLDDFRLASETAPTGQGRTHLGLGLAKLVHIIRELEDRVAELESKA